VALTTLSHTAPRLKKYLCYIHVLPTPCLRVLSQGGLYLYLYLDSNNNNNHDNQDKDDDGMANEYSNNNNNNNNMLTDVAVTGDTNVIKS